PGEESQMRGRGECVELRSRELEEADVQAGIRAANVHRGRQAGVDDDHLLRAARGSDAQRKHCERQTTHWDGSSRRCGIARRRVSTSQLPSLAAVEFEHSQSSEGDWAAITCCCCWRRVRCASASAFVGALAEWSKAPDSKSARALLRTPSVRSIRSLAG